MLTSPTHLRDELLKLDGDIGGLGGRRVALIGFRDPNQKRVSDNLRVLREVPGWTLVDARESAGESLMTALTEGLDTPHLALLLDVSAPIPTDASLFIRALHDSRDSVVWTDRTESRIPGKRLLHVIAMGARSIEDLPQVLRRIDFMTFIRPS